MTRALFLISDGGRKHSDNARRIPDAFRGAGWDVAIAAHDDVRWTPQDIRVGSTPIDQYDLVWPVGFGPRATFWDRTQLLYGVDSRNFITSPQALAHYHNKALWLEFAPRSAVSHRPDALRRFGEQHGGRWVLKPTVGSGARDVHLLGDLGEIETRMAQRPGGYWILQRFLPEISAGETRALIAGGTLIGQYLRRPPAGEITANLSAGARAYPSELSAAQQRRVEALTRTLAARRIGFAAIDLCGEFVIEVNIADPGGLGTLTQLAADGEAHARAIEEKLVEAVGAWVRAGIQ